jgi:hypothetical protein
VEEVLMGNPNAPASWGLAAAVAAGIAEPISWVTVPYEPDGVLLVVPADALRMPFPQAGGRVMRVPCSYREQVQLCRAQGWASMTVAWAQAVWKAAPKKQRPVELVVTAADAYAMGTLAFLEHAEDLRDAEVAGYAPGEWGRGMLKGWYVDPMMSEQGADGACNWGFVEPNGQPDQTPGGRHNNLQIDYSQALYDFVPRWLARLDGSGWVDAVELQCARFPSLATRTRQDYGPPPPMLTT